MIVKFIINKEGNIINPQIVQGLGYGCDEEVIRVVKRMPRWIPGKQNGVNVSVYYTLPVQFKMRE